MPKVPSRSQDRLGMLAMTLAVMAAVPAWAEGPRRIVSLDLCTDQLLIELVDRRRIAAVTHLAADPAVSAIPEKARGLPVTRGQAEDVLRYDPDLILAGPWGVSATVGLLRRLGRNVVIVPLPQDLDGVRASVRAVAAAVGAQAEGEVMTARFDRRLAALGQRNTDAAPPTAVVYQVGGVVSGSASLANGLLAAAGLRNIAGDYRLSGSGQVQLEALIADPPDVLVLSSGPTEYRTALADNLRHPALALLRQRQPSLELPWQMWLCGTPHVVDALERLARARDEIEARRR